jgi:hypothetical protein
VKIPAALLSVALLLVITAPSARAADLAGTLDPPSVTRARGLTTIGVHGKLAAATDRPFVVRLRRATPGPLDEDRVALESPPKLEPDGLAFSAALATPGLLAAGSYTLEVAPAGDAARSSFAAPLAIGTAEEAAAAERRLVAWYRGAYGTFRDLATGLERRGLYHLALLRRTKDEVHRRRFLAPGQFLTGWRASLLAARMDLATWERRVVLPSHAQVGKVLLRLVALLEARAKAWDDALTSPDVAVDAATKTALDAAAAELRAAMVALGAETEAALLAEWDVGPLAEPPPGSPAGTEALKGVAFSGGWGVLRDEALGFTLEVPEVAGVAAADQSPNDRVILDVPKRTETTTPAFRVIVQVRDYPGHADDELAAALEVNAWEGYSSYERTGGRALSAADGGPGLRLELDASFIQRADDATGTAGSSGWIRVVQRSLWRRLPGGVPRVVTVVIVRAHDHDHPEKDAPYSADMARVEESLKLLGSP